MKTCEVCGKPVPRNSKLCEECEKGVPLVEAGEDVLEAEPEEDTER